MHDVASPWFAVLGPTILYVPYYRYVLWMFWGVEPAYLAGNAVVFLHKIASLPTCDLGKLTVFGKPSVHAGMLKSSLDHACS